MASNDKRNQEQEYANEHHRRLTSGELQNILEVNKKAIEIHLEVERQNEDIIEILKHCKTKIDEVEKNLFKLLIVLGSIGAGGIIGIIQFLLHK